MRTLTSRFLNKLHGPMYYKIGVTCVYNGHVLYTPRYISQFNRLCNELTSVWSMFSCNMSSWFIERATIDSSFTIPLVQGTFLKLSYKSLVYNSLVYDSLVYNSLVYNSLVYKSLVYKSLVYNSLINHWFITHWFITHWFITHWFITLL